MTIRQTIGSFELHLLAGNKSPKTVRTYTDAVRKLAAEQGISDLAAVSRQDIERHIVSLLGRYSPGYASNQFRRCSSSTSGWRLTTSPRPDGRRLICPGWWSSPLR